MESREIYFGPLSIKHKLAPKEIMRSGIKRASPESSESSSEDSESPDMIVPPSFSRLFKVGLERKNQGEGGREGGREREREISKNVNVHFRYSNSSIEEK